MVPNHFGVQCSLQPPGRIARARAETSQDASKAVSWYFALASPRKRQRMTGGEIAINLLLIIGIEGDGHGFSNSNGRDSILQRAP